MNYEENLVDFHCHLDLYPHFERLIDECEGDRIKTLAVTTTPRAWPRNRDLAKNLKYVKPALGLHPQLITSNFEGELALWESYLPQADIVGEVGLDAGPNFVSNLEYQKKAFRRIVECCSDAGGKILSIHSVRSASLVIDIIKEFPNAQNRYIFHWFSGSLTELIDAISLGSYFSINSSMLSSTKGRNLINRIPAHRILTETDGPFTSDRQGDPFTPMQVDLVLDQLSTILQMNKSELRRKINENLRCLFRQ